MSTKLSPVKRSSRTPKLSAKMIALEAEVSQKKRQKPLELKEKASPPPAATPAKLAKPKTPSSAGSSRKRKSTTSQKKSRSTPAKPQKDPSQSPAEIDVVSGVEQASPLKSLSESMMYEEENDLDVTQFTDSGPLVVDDTSNTTSTSAFPSSSNSTTINFDKKLKKPKAETGNSDDEAEEKWLQALENGKLEEIDSELKSMKDPRLMTARQRAVIEAKQAKVEQLQKFQAMLDAPKDPLAGEMVSEEFLEKKAQKAAKRKQLAEEKRDKEKKDTIKRLLKKADSRQKLKKLQKQKAQLIPKVSYRYTYEASSVSFPVETPPQSLGLDLSPKAVQYVNEVLCSNPGCAQVKKYQCSSNGFPVCSLQCYRQVVSLPPLSQLLDVANVSVNAEVASASEEFSPLKTQSAK